MRKVPCLKGAARIKKLYQWIISVLCMGIFLFFGEGLGTICEGASIEPVQENVESMTAVKAKAHTFGDGEKVAEIILQYPAELSPENVNVSSYKVSKGQVVSAYTNDEPIIAAKPKTGQYVILQLAYEREMPKAMPAKSDAQSKASEQREAPMYSNRTRPDLSM